MSTNWHTVTMAAMRSKTNESLEFIRKDAVEAAMLAYQMGNPKAGHYADEAHYANMELARRRENRAKFEARIERANGPVALQGAV